ncbi:hypothetical protein BJ741DRAFT_591852 [Chytriomyces cf. hyalinus JEL632]|nr:hypothetical protein BJ741DRAFT_591852 [Chytriomyces cf. hyalinus JEL632]
MNSVILTDLSTTSSAPALHATFAAFQQSVRDQAKRDVTVTLPRLIQVIRHVLNTEVVQGPHQNHHIEKNQALLADESPSSPTETPRKKRRRAKGRRESFRGSNDNEADDFCEDDDSLEATPVPVHGALAVELGGAGGIAGYDSLSAMNGEVKELMRLVKRELTQVLHAVSRVKMWIQLDDVAVPNFDTLSEMAGIEKWVMNTLESFHSYHTKRAKLVHELDTYHQTCTKKNSASRDADVHEAIVEMDDVQVQHLILSLREGLLCCALLYSKLKGFFTLS